MKNILIVSTSLVTQGGISSVLKELMNSKLNQKYKLYHLVTHINGSTLLKILYLIRSYVLFPFVLIFRNIRIVHIHGGMKSSFMRKSYFLVVGKLMRKKVIFHMHSAMVDEYMARCNPLKKRLVIKLFNKYDAIVTISKYWEKVMRSYTQSDIYVIYNPVKSKEIVLPENIPRKITVLTLGELGNRKGTENIIKIAASLKDENIVFIVGGNGDVERFKALASEYGVEEKVIFKGWVSGQEKEELIRSASIYFLPSYFEGLPMSIIEAMSYGLPVVSTEVGGIPEIVIQDYNGMVHKPTDLEGMKNSINKLKESPGLIRQMRENSIKVVRRLLDIEQISAEVDMLYQKIDAN